MGENRGRIGKGVGAVEDKLMQRVDVYRANNLDLISFSPLTTGSGNLLPVG